MRSAWLLVEHWHLLDFAGGGGLGCVYPPRLLTLPLSSGE